MAKEILCFADDTTEALDVGGSFHSRGYLTEVYLESNYKSYEAPCNVLNLNNRYATSEESNDLLSNALKQIDKGVLNSLNLYLKVDSTLRGNVLSDISTISNILPDKPIFLAPSFPFYGRTCFEGIYYVNGKRVIETDFAKDKALKFRTAYLSDNRENIQHIDWRILSQGPESVVERIANSNMDKFTFDTRNQADLEIIATAGLLLNAVFVGSSGLARAFPKDRSELDTFIPNKNIPSLFVIGSIHEISRIQKRKLSDEGISGIEIPKQQIRDINKLKSIREQIYERLNHGSTIFVSTPDEFVNGQNLSVGIDDSIGEATNITDMSHNLVIVGGETARATLKSRKINKLAVRGEYQAGIPITSEKDRKEAIFTKAGGFGNSNTLVDIYRLLQE